MDVDLIFLLMLFVFYFLSRLGGKKKPQQRPDNRPQDAGAPQRENTELDDALREIREALGWPSSSEEVEVPERETPTAGAPAGPPPSPVERRETTMERRDREDDRQVSSRPARQPSIPSTLRGSAPRREAYAAYTGVDAKKAPRARLNLPAPESPGLSSERKQHPLLTKLRTTQGAREAVVYSEVFEPKWRKQIK